MYGVEAPGWRVPSISRPHWLVSAPPQRPTYKNGFNSAKHNNLESGEGVQELYVNADCQNLIYQLEQRRMAGPPFLALTKSHVLKNKIKLVVFREVPLVALSSSVYAWRDHRVPKPEN